MILNAANLNRNELVFSCNTTDVCPDTLFDIPVNKVFAAFRAEYDVIEEI